MPTKRHCGVQFFVHHFQRFGHAGLTHGTEAVDIGSADHRSGCAKGFGFEDILPATDPAIHPDLAFAIHRFDNFWQHTDRR